MCVCVSCVGFERYLLLLNFTFVTLVGRSFWFCGTLRWVGFCCVNYFATLHFK